MRWSHPDIIETLWIMDDWLGLPVRHYQSTVYLFARELPAAEILRATHIAQKKLPAGGPDAFRYFCGICHRLRKQLAIERELDQLEAESKANQARWN